MKRVMMRQMITSFCLMTGMIGYYDSILLAIQLVTLCLLCVRVCVCV